MYLINERFYSYNEPGLPASNPLVPLQSVPVIQLVPHLLQVILKPSFLYIPGLNNQFNVFLLQPTVIGGAVIR